MYLKEMENRSAIFSAILDAILSAISMAPVGRIAFVASC